MATRWLSIHLVLRDDRVTASLWRITPTAGRPRRDHVADLHLPGVSGQTPPAEVLEALAAQMRLPYLERH